MRGLVPLSEVLATARAGGYAVGYFEAWDTYSLEAVAEAAWLEKSPVVLGFGGMMMDQGWLHGFGIEPLGAYGRCVAEGLRVPAALILNEVWEFEHARRGIGAGYNVVMLNTCELPFEENARLTKRLVGLAHPEGVEVQAELGRLPSYGEEESGEVTDAAQAREFVEATGVDFLAVSVGNVHLRTDGAAGIDLGLLRKIRAAVDVPLVIHGGSGLADDDVRTLIEAGVELFHVGTVMKRRYLEEAEAALAAQPERRDYQALVGSRKASDFLMPGKAAIVETVRGLMKLYGSSGKAE